MANKFGEKWVVFICEKDEICSFSGVPVQLDVDGISRDQKNPGIMNVKKSRDLKISPGISRRDFFPSFYEILSEMLFNFLVLMENLALHTNEVSIFCHVKIINS
jgi:hypothetical protein